MTTRTFRYNTRMAAGPGRYTTQPNARGRVSTAEFVADVAAATGESPALTEKLLHEFCRQIIDRTTDSWRIEPLFDLLGFNASCGGAFDSYDIAPTYQNLNVRHHLLLGKAGQAYAREGFRAELIDSQGRIVPVIKAVTDKASGSVNTYTSGQGLEINLARSGAMDIADSAQGLFLTDSTGHRTRVSGYLKTNGKTLYCIVPADLTGPQQLSLVQSFGGEPRTGIYDFPLQPANTARPSPVGPTVAGNGNGPVHGNGNGLTPAPRATRPASHITPAAPRSRSRTGQPQPQPQPAPLTKTPAK